MRYPQQKTVCQLDENGIFIGTTQADLSPLEAEAGVYLLPANTIDTLPPKTQQGFAAQWQENQWQYVEDHRGKVVYSTENGQAITIHELGALPEQVTETSRPSPHHQWNGREWQISMENQGKLLTQHRADLIQQIADKADQFKTQILVGYPQTEIDSFYRQEREARAWTADNQTPTPMLSAIAENRGMPLDLLCKKVIEKAELFATIIGNIVGKRQAFEDRILAATADTQLTQLAQEINQWQLDLNA